MRSAKVEGLRPVPAMRQLSAETMSQIMLGLGMLFGLVILGVLIVQRFRGGAAHSGLSAGELMANFQEMRGRGDISDADYRKIKAVLGDKLQGELKDGKDKP